MTIALICIAVFFAFMFGAVFGIGFLCWLEAQPHKATPFIAMPYTQSHGERGEK